MPPAPDLENYNLTPHNITGSTQISRKTTLIVSQLRGSLQTENASVQERTSKPNIVALTAKARYANKLISIVEIAKRELAESGENGGCFQYNAVGEVMVEVERKKDATDDDGEGDGDGDGDGDEEEDAFETIEARFITGDKKKRAVPVLKVYLSLVSVKELKNAYGEQR